MSVARSQIMASSFFLWKVPLSDVQCLNSCSFQDTRLSSSTLCSFHTCIPPLLAQTGTQKPNQTHRDRLMFLFTVNEPAESTCTVHAQTERGHRFGCRWRGGGGGVKEGGGGGCLCCVTWWWGAKKAARMTPDDTLVLSHLPGGDSSAPSISARTHTSESQLWRSTCWLVRSYFSCWRSQVSP